MKNLILVAAIMLSGWSIAYGEMVEDFMGPEGPEYEHMAPGHRVVSGWAPCSMCHHANNQPAPGMERLREKYKTTDELLQGARRQKHPVTIYHRKRFFIERAADALFGRE